MCLVISIAYQLTNEGETRIILFGYFYIFGVAIDSYKSFYQKFGHSWLKEGTQCADLYFIEAKMFIFGQYIIVCYSLV